MNTLKILILGLAITSTSALADEGAKDGPCKQVVEACQSAGFTKGKAKEGTGLWVDCVKPIMTGTPNPKAKNPLPQISAETITACKAKHPNFGVGKK